MEFLLPLISFAFVTSVTPGPNNILLLASGLRFGFVKTLPHIAGIQAGVALQLFFSALGLGYLIMQVPAVNLVLKIIGTVYLLYLAWILRGNSLDKDGDEKTRPFTFLQALLFQFINPKAWLMTLTAGALFLPNLSSNILSACLLCLVFSSVGTPSSGSWALVGGIIRQFLNDAFWQRIFSLLMISLILLTAIYIWRI